MSNQIVIEIDGLDRLRAAFRTSPNRVKRGLDKAITRSALLVQREARQEAPVDVGFLRNSIGIRYQKLGARVAPTVKYALWVHEGTGRFARNGGGRSTPWVYKDRTGAFRRTRGQKANPFMERAVSLSEPSIRSVFQSTVSEIVAETS